MEKTRQAIERIARDDRPAILPDPAESLDDARDTSARIPRPLAEGWGSLAQVERLFHITKQMRKYAIVFGK